MPYTATTFNSGAGPGIDSGVLNTMQTQYTEATQSFGPDLFTAFVLTGMVVTADGSVLTQIDMTSGTAYVKQSADNTLRRRAISSQNFSATGHPSATMYLDLNPDGTFSWATTHSGTANYLTIATVTTDASAHISTVTDTRTLATSLLPSASGKISFPGAISFDGGKITTDGSGTLQTTVALATTTTEGGAHVWKLFTRTAGIGNDNCFSVFDATTSVTALTLDTSGNGTVNGTLQTGNGAYFPKLLSNGGGASGRAIWVGTTDPGASAAEGDVWING